MATARTNEKVRALGKKLEVKGTASGLHGGKRNSKKKRQRPKLPFGRRVTPTAKLRPVKQITAEKRKDKHLEGHLAVCDKTFERNVGKGEGEFTKTSDGAKLCGLMLVLAEKKFFRKTKSIRED